MKSISTLFRQLSLIVVLISAFSLSALSAVYEKVTTAPSDWSGDYLIVYEDGNVAFNGALTTLDAVSNTVAVTIADSKIEANEAMKAAQFTINASGHIKSASGYYIGQTSDANELKSSTSTPYTNTLSLNADGTVNIVSGGAYLRFNAAADQTRFRYYKSSSYTGQKAICLYKLVEEQGGGDEPETPCTKPTISFAETTITKTNGDANFTNALNTGGSTGNVTYTTENENIATVNATTGEVTINGVGTTTITATVAADGTYCEATAEYTLTVEGRTFNITWKNGAETHTTTTYTEGGTLTLPTTDPTSCSDNYSTFVGWYTQQAGPTSNPSTKLQGTEASKTVITGNTTFYAVFGKAGEGGATIASLTEDKIKTNFTNDKCAYATGETYTDSENDIIWTSYGYADANGRPWIQYKKGSNYYLQATTQQPVKKIILTITAADNTAGGVADITKHTAYSSSGTITISDGTKTITTASGSTVSDNILEIDLSNNTSNTIRILTSTGCRIWNVELSFTSLSSSAYISICDGEEVIIPDDPTFNPAGGDFTETQQVTISAQDGASIYYTLNSDDPTTESIPYNGAIEISTTTTIKAIAVLNGVESSVSETEYRINIVDDIATFITKAPTVETKILGTVTVVAQDQWKQRTWIQDANGSAMIDNSSKDVELTFGDQLKGIVGTFSSNNINVTSLPEKEATTATPTTKETKTIGEITTNDLHKYIRIENVTFGGSDGTYATFTDETGSIKTYESYLQTDYSSINEDQKVSLNAIVGVFNNVLQIYVVSFDIVREPAIYADDIVNFGDVIENNESTKTITITTVDLGGSANISISGTNASYFAVNPTSIKDNSETEITITFTAPDVEVQTECTATLTIKGGGQTKEIALTATVKPLLALTANINGITQEVGSFAEGADITEKLNNISVTAPEGWSFAGWVANAIDGSQTTTPEYLTTMPAEATTAYAVFKLGKEVNKEFSFAITAADFNGTSYATNNNEKTSTATAIDGTETEVKWTSYQVMLQSGVMQWQKSNGYIYNSTDLGTITNIAITSSAGTFTTYKGTSEKPTSAGEGGYFQIKTGSSAVGKTSGVTITFEKSVSSYTYRTSVSSLVVTNDDTETISEDINSLTLYVDKTPNTQLKVTKTITADKVTIIQTIDASRWFFFSLPFDCKISDIVATDANGKELEYAKDATSGDYVINQYNQTRAEGKDKAWEELLGTEHKLNANQGYIIGHFGKGDVTVKFHSTEAQTISAPADKTLNYTNTWFVGGDNSSKGFNLIGMPYYQNINSNISCDSVYIYSIYSTTPNADGKTYTQEEYTGNNVAPFTSFFVQVTAAPTFTITETQSAAPMLRAKDVVAKATITLADANGGADETTVINNPTKTTDYEIGHDLVKWIGYAEIPQIYSIQGEDILAFNSLAMNNETIIPLGVYAHADGDYTFSLSDKSMGNLEGWELYDSESGKAVALTDESLTVTLSKGTHEGRFSIRMEQGTTTDCECDMSNIVTYMNNGTFYIENMPAEAMVYIYDAVGRMIYATETTDTSFDYTFALRGVYNVVVCTEYNSIAYKTIY